MLHSFFPFFVAVVKLKQCRSALQISLSLSFPADRQLTLVMYLLVISKQFLSAEGLGVAGSGLLCV